MNQHTLKFPIIEQIVSWRMNLFGADLASSDGSLTRQQQTDQFNKRLFELRRDLWTRDVPWLIATLQQRPKTQTA